jgi:hypothetical protein
MADTQQTWAAAIALAADNTTGAISPQDLRNIMTTLRMSHGQLYVAAADSGDITINNTSDYEEATAMTWTLSSGARLWDESDGNGKLTYTGTNPMTANQETHWRVGVNGTTDAASEVIRKTGTANDIGSTAIHLIVTVSNGDHVSLFGRNATSTANLTIEAANLQAVAMIN